jgi:hypothetical protein
MRLFNIRFLIALVVISYSGLCNADFDLRFFPTTNTPPRIVEVIDGQKTILFQSDVVVTQVLWAIQERTIAATKEGWKKYDAILLNDQRKRENILQEAKDQLFLLIPYFVNTEVFYSNPDEITFYDATNLLSRYDLPLDYFANTPVRNLMGNSWPNEKTRNDGYFYGWNWMSEIITNLTTTVERGGYMLVTSGRATIFQSGGPLDCFIDPPLSYPNTIESYVEGASANDYAEEGFYIAQDVSYSYLKLQRSVDEGYPAVWLFDSKKVNTNFFYLTKSDADRWVVNEGGWEGGGEFGFSGPDDEGAYRACPQLRLTDAWFVEGSPKTEKILDDGNVLLADSRVPDRLPCSARSLLTFSGQPACEGDNLVTSDCLDFGENPIVTEYQGCSERESEIRWSSKFAHIIKWNFLYTKTK